MPLFSTVPTAASLASDSAFATTYVPLAGSATIAGAKNFTTGPTVGGVPIAATALTERGTWVTSTVYAVDDVVNDAANGQRYTCHTAHTSGTFATDLSGGKWVTTGASKGYVDITASASVVDATTSAKGVVKLAGDLAGTATLPQVTVTHLASALPINQGGTAATTAAAALTSLGAAPLASPALTGTPIAPTATGGTNTTQLATTAYVQGEVAGKAPLDSPTFTGTPAAPTAVGGTNTTQVATTAFVQSAVSGGNSPPPIANATTSNVNTTTDAYANVTGWTVAVPAGDYMAQAWMRINNAAGASNTAALFRGTVDTGSLTVTTAGWAIDGNYTAGSTTPSSTAAPFDPGGDGFNVAAGASHMVQVFIARLTFSADCNFTPQIGQGVADASHAITLLAGAVYILTWLSPPVP